jgi:uncharacterized protein (TIGR02246 family)
MSRLGSVLLCVLLLTAGCTIEDHTPTGTRRDEAAVRAVVATYYRTVGDRNWRAGRSVFWDSADVTLNHRSGDSGWISFEGADEYFVYLARSAPAGSQSYRLIRTDFHQQGDLAAVWVTARMSTEGDSVDLPESGEVDHFVLRRFGNGWRIIYLASEPESPAVQP